MPPGFLLECCLGKWSLPWRSVTEQHVCEVGSGARGCSGRDGPCKTEMHWSRLFLQVARGTQRLVGRMRTEACVCIQCGFFWGKWPIFGSQTLFSVLKKYLPPLQIYMQIKKKKRQAKTLFWPALIFLFLKAEYEWNWVPNFSCQMLLSFLGNCC